MANKVLHTLKNKCDVSRCTWFDAGGRRMNRLLLAAVAVAVALSMMTVPASAQIQPVTKVPAGPTYTVEVHGFTAIDESGADWTGSDEVFGLFHSNVGSPVKTRTFGDVDSGEFRRIPSLERCLAPQRLTSGGRRYGWLWVPHATWNCRPSQGGVAGPIHLNMELLEDDDCNAFFPSCFNSWWPPGIRDPNDDVIGVVDVTYSAAELARRLPRVGDVIVDKFTLGGPCGNQPPDHVCGNGPLSSSGPEYKLTINIRKATDSPVHALG
jgi:hypothetical protein